MRRSLLDIRVVFHCENALSLLCDTSCPTFASSLQQDQNFVHLSGEKKKTYLVLDTASLHLVGEDLCTVLLCFSFVDILHKHTFVLEDVTL